MATASVLSMLRTLSPRRLSWSLRTTLLRRQGYEPDVRRIVRSHVTPGSICADVGAFEGLIARELARAAGPEGRVYAFEPHAETAAGLEAALRKEGLSEWISVERVAISDGRSPTATLYAGRPGLPSEWNIVGHDVEGRSAGALYEVGSVSLDERFPPGSRLDFVKIDVEGAEGLVLQGMQRLLRDARPAIVVEFHGEEGWRDRQVLLDAGYRLFDAKGCPAGDERLYHCLALPS